MMAFDKNKEVIADMNTDQLWEGKRSDGVTLPDYSPVSVAVYGKPPGPIKLYDTGKFYRGIEAVAGRDQVDIIGNDSITAELEQRYGGEIIGLTEENEQDLKDNYIVPAMREIIKKLINERL